MRKKRSLVFAIATITMGAAILSGCSKGGAEDMTTTPTETTPIETQTDNITETTEAETPLKTVTIKIDSSIRSPFNNGKFEGWGTSLCW